jgi:peptide-methionine (R)-S-oxide reductase
MTARTGPARGILLQDQKETGMDDTTLPTEDELRERLTPLQFQVTQKAGTEPAFTGDYWDAHDPGTYHCIVCNEPLFNSDTKFDSGTGWPSFWQAIDRAKVKLIEDRAHGMVRTEVRCARCDAHLGHVFPDGPKPTGERYCMNSASLTLEKAGNGDV